MEDNNIIIELPADTWEEILQALRKCAIHGRDDNNDEQYHHWMQIARDVNVRRVVSNYKFRKLYRPVNRYEKYELPKRQTVVLQSKMNTNENIETSNSDELYPDEYENQPTFAVAGIH